MELSDWIFDNIIFQHVPRNVYRGYLELLKLLVEGYETSVDQKGQGGLSSVFPLCEVAHRYFCGKKYEDDSSEKPESASSSRRTSVASAFSSVTIENSNEVGSDSSLYFHRGKKISYYPLRIRIKIELKVSIISIKAKISLVTVCSVLFLLVVFVAPKNNFLTEFGFY